VERVRGGRDEYREYINGPAYREAVGDVRERRLLDVACGEGFFSRVFAREGAIVTSIDLSEEMIDAAVEEEWRSPFGISNHVADVDDLKMIESWVFDVACSFVALMDIHDYRSAVSEVARALSRAGGLSPSIPASAGGGRRTTKCCATGRSVSLRTAPGITSTEGVRLLPEELMGDSLEARERAAGLLHHPVPQAPV